MAHVVQPADAGFPKDPFQATSMSPGIINNKPYCPGTDCGPAGERLVVHVVDELARKSPDRVWATITKSLYNISDGFEDITFQQLSNAVNAVAWDISSRFGRSDKFDVIAYLGVSDVRYAIYMFAAIKAGYQIMIPSVRNSVPQHISVLEAASCNKIIHTPEMSSRIDELVSAKPGINTVLAPSLESLTQSTTHHFEYKRTWAEGRTDPIIVAHSSGSTGNPKPTTITNGVYSVYDNHRKIPAPPGRRVQSYQLLDLDGGRFFNPFPPFHLAGLFAMTIMPIFYNCVVTLGPPEKPPSGELLSQAMSKLNIRAAWCPPSVIEQVVDMQGGFEQVASLDWIMYTGGPLATAVGDRLSKVTDVCQMYGSTETGPHTALVPLPSNWNYFEWHPDLMNEMDPMGDGTYEMVVHRDASRSWVSHLSQAYPDLEVWRTNDLFVQSPHDANLWRFAGRRDDVIVLSNGEKFNPVTMESIITGHPLVKGALILGTGKFQAALLIEPVDYSLLASPDNSAKATSDLIDELWSTVEEANAAGPAHGRIFRSKVTIAKPEKPFARAGKGTVIRGRTSRLYTEEIDNLYVDDEGDEQNGPVITISDTTSLDCISLALHQVMAKVLSRQVVSDQDDIFVAGTDSLQTLELVKLLRKVVARSIQQDLPAVNWISAASIYKNPTIQQLASLINTKLNGSRGEKTGDSRSSLTTTTSSRIEAMAQLVDKYSSDLRIPVRRVAITGSTGSLGGYILEVFLNDPRIERIYCLNRSNDALERHERAFKDRGKTYDLTSKVVFMTTDLADARLGLSDDMYALIRDRCDAIIHNAWKVDFNQQLASFETQIRGVRHLIDLSSPKPSSSQGSQETKKPHLFFVSSLSSVGNWPKVYGSQTQVPEAKVEDFEVALEMGYGESKHVAERIIAAAVENVASGLKATVLRVGQVAGPLGQMSGGEWNRTEWFPSLIKSSLAIGMLPDSMNAIDWIPVDTLADIIRDLVLHDTAKRTSPVYNVVNPTSAQWSDLTSAIVERHPEVKLVSFDDWIAALRSTSLSLDSVPALKIIDFYQGLGIEAGLSPESRVSYSTRRCEMSSSTMSSLQPIDKEAMGTWLRQWQFKC